MHIYNIARRRTHHCSQLQAPYHHRNLHRSLIRQTPPVRIAVTTYLYMHVRMHTVAYVHRQICRTGLAEWLKLPARRTVEVASTADSIIVRSVLLTDVQCSE